MVMDHKEEMCSLAQRVCDSLTGNNTFSTGWTKPGHQQSRKKTVNYFPQIVELLVIFI